MINRRGIFTARLDEVKGRLIDFFFPPKCVGCGSEGSFVCPACQAALPRLRPPVCPVCSKPLRSGEDCPNCRRWTLEIAGIRAPFAFRGLMRKAIHQLKYGQFRALAGPLGQMLGRYLEQEPLPADVLVPVPLHPRRLRQRGYNQSDLLAAEAGRWSGLPVYGDCLLRLRHTRPQVKTDGAPERRLNLAGVFGCQSGKVFGKRVLLVDDVCTTGATLNYCAMALREAGASSVWGLALAREE